MRLAEPGSYARLLCPILAAVFAGRPNAAALFLSAAAVALFLAYGPFVALIRNLLGRGGAGARRGSVSRSIAVGAALGAAAAVCGGIGLLLVVPPLRLSVVPALACAGVAFAMAAFRRPQALGGEISTAAAFSATAMPIAAASTKTFSAGMAIAIVLGTGFAMLTFAARGAVSGRRPWWRSLAVRAVALAAIAPVALTLAWRYLGWPRGAIAAIAPFSIAALWMVLALPPHARQRLAGRTLVAASVLSSLFLIWALR